MSDTINSDAISKFVISASERTLPAAVQEAARMCLVDWFGVAVGAHEEGVARSVCRVADQWRSDGKARMLLGGASNPAVSALVNGTLAHALDFDDTHLGSMSHLSGPTWAAVLAVGMSLSSEPSDMLTAFAVGFEVGGAIGSGGFGEALSERTLHPTGICGCFAATAAASVLYRLNADEVQNALGAAATQASGLTSSFGTMSKPFHAGKAAFNGVVAAQLAKAGFVAARNLLEDAGGIGAALVQDRSCSIPRLELGGRWKILDNTFKPYASCLMTHPVIDTARKLRAEIGGRAISEISIGVHPLGVLHAGKPYPRSPLEGKFSTAFCAALAFSGYDAGHIDFNATLMEDVRIRDLAARVRLVPIATLPKTAASIDVTLSDGSRLSAETALALGNPGNPLRWEDIERKFIGLTVPVLKSRTKDVLGWLRRFSDIRDIEKAFAATAPAPDATHRIEPIEA